MLGLKAGFVRRLLKWYEANRRDLPWRRARGSDRALDPYHVLVSEAMLQQTQVATVIPYYARFISRFPTIFDLANAQEQEVLRLWQGLGYYSRARNLQAAARAIARDHNGQVPRSTDDLLKLPGVGRYTAGAVACFAYEQPVSMVDTNVRRVLGRLGTTPQAPPGDAPRLNQALMELGATVCTARAPRCDRCPLRAGCPGPAPAPTPVGERPRERFEDSRRFVRGRVVAALAAGEGLPAGIAAERLQPALDGLVRDGLVRRTENGFALADGRGTGAGGSLR